MAKLHTAGDESSELIDYEMNEIEECIRLEMDAMSQTSWMELFRTPANRKRTVIATVLGWGAQWNGIGVVSYYLTLVLNTIGITSVESQALINGLLQVFNFGAAVFGGALMVDRLGRRKLFLIGTGGLLCSYIAWTILTSQFIATKNPILGNAVVAFIFLAYFFYNIAWNPLLQAYPVEIYPYTLRSRGLSYTLVMSSVALITGQFVNPIALKAIGWMYYIVFCVILSILFLLIWFLFPETKGRTLEEVAEIFDGTRVSALVAERKASTSARHEEKSIGTTLRDMES